MLAESEEWSDDRAAERTEVPLGRWSWSRATPTQGARSDCVFMQRREAEWMETEEKGGRPAHIALPAGARG